MFRNEVERFIGVELVEAAVEPGCRVRALGVPVQGFCDPSGGASDSMTLAIGHCEKDDRAVLDCLVERRAPFSPTSVVSVFAETLKSYGVRKVTGDRYSANGLGRPSAGMAFCTSRPRCRSPLSTRSSCRS